MAILTEDDQPVYFPAVPVGDSLAGFLVRAQAIAEGPLGSDRPLELTQYIDHITIHKRFQQGHLKYLPIAASPAPVVQVRQGNYTNVLGRPHPVSNWVTLNATDYQLEETGRLNLSISTTYGFSVGLSFATEAKVTYTSGFDFTDDTAQVNAIKSIVGSLVTHLYFSEGGGTPGAGPVTRWEEKDVLSIAYGESAYQGKSGRAGDEAIASICRPLKQYLPRRF